MKQTGILFSPDMAQATINEIKEVTRRLFGENCIINDDPDRYKFLGMDDNGCALFEDLRPEITPWIVPIPCRYGREGDILYGRENYYQYGHWEEIPGVKTKTSRQKWKFVPDSKEVLFVAPEVYRSSRQGLLNPRQPAWYKRLARFMPKEYARIWLEIKGVTAERVQDITEEQARVEGAYRGIFRYGPKLDECQLELNGSSGFYFDGFKYIWVRINGFESWKANPWVFAISFKALSTTGKPDNL